MMKIVTLLMTSRSGSSMVTDIFVKHNFYWAKDERRNPQVGGRKVKYHSFENQVVKEFNKNQFGTPLGEMISHDDTHLNGFKALIHNEYPDGHFCVWKGAVEFFPLWEDLNNTDPTVEICPCIIWRPMQAVKDSLRAKRQGKVNEAELDRITGARYEIMGRLATDYAFPVIETDKLVAGDLSSIEQAFDYYGFNFDPEIARSVIKPSKWETER